MLFICGIVDELVDRGTNNESECHSGDHTILSWFLGAWIQTIAIFKCYLFIFYIFRYSWYWASILWCMANCFPHILLFLYWESLPSSWHGTFFLDSDFLSNFPCDAKEERGLAPSCGLQKQCYQNRQMYQNKIWSRCIDIISCRTISQYYTVSIFFLPPLLNMYKKIIKYDIRCFLYHSEKLIAKALWPLLPTSSAASEAFTQAPSSYWYCSGERNLALYSDFIFLKQHRQTEGTCVEQGIDGVHMLV